MPIDETYKFKVGSESIDQYNQRISGYNASKAPAAAPAPINRTVYDGQQYNPATTSAPTGAETFLDTFRAPESSEQIAERKRRQSQGLIDSIDKTFDDRIAERKVVHGERLNMDNALSVITGNTGGSEAIRTRKNTLDANDKEVTAINNERALALSRVYTDISSAADTEAREQLADATRSAEQIMARREQSQSKAIESLKLMASGGLVDFEAFRDSPQNGKVFQYALDSVGGSEQSLRALFMLNRPQDQLVGEPVRMGSNYVQAYQNPLTGKIKYEQLELPFDLPTEYNSFQKMGNNLVAVPDNWDGDISKLKTVYSEAPGAAKRETQVIDVDGKKVLIDTQTGEEIKSIGGGTASPAQTAAVSRAAEVQSLVKRIKESGDVNTITGKWELRRNLPGGKQDTMADVERLKALLAIDAIKDFKGLGPMSEREFGTASAAASSLDFNRTSSGFTSELDRINTAMDTVKNGFSSSVTGDLSSQLQPGEILVRDKATGQIGAIPANEYDASKYDRQ